MSAYLEATRPGGRGLTEDMRTMLNPWGSIRLRFDFRFISSWEAEVRFLGDLADGAFAVESLHASDPVRIAELVATYRDLPLGASMPR